MVSLLLQRKLMYSHKGTYCCVLEALPFTVCVKSEQSEVICTLKLMIPRSSSFTGTLPLLCPPVSPAPSQCLVPGEHLKRVHAEWKLGQTPYSDILISDTDLIFQCPVRWGSLFLGEFLQRGRELIISRGALGSCVKSRRMYEFSLLKPGASFSAPILLALPLLS